MTFLCFGIENGAIQVAMDTLASVDTGEKFYLEKSFYLKNSNLIISSKGSINILGPFILEMLRCCSAYSTASQVERWVKAWLNRRLLERVRKTPRLEGQPAELWLFSWKNGVPTFFEARYRSFEDEFFTFREGILQEGYLGNTNDVSIHNPLARTEWGNLGLILEESELKYGKDSYTSMVIFNSAVAKINEAPLIGGDLFLYSLRDNNDFSKKIIYQLSPAPSERLTIREVTMEANGNLT